MRINTDWLVLAVNLFYIYLVTLHERQSLLQDKWSLSAICLRRSGYP